MTKTILYAIAAALIAVPTLAVAAPTQQPELAGRGGGAAPHSGPRVYRFDQTILSRGFRALVHAQPATDLLLTAVDACRW